MSENISSLLTKCKFCQLETRHKGNLFRRIRISHPDAYGKAKACAKECFENNLSAKKSSVKIKSILGIGDIKSVLKDIISQQEIRKHGNHLKSLAKIGSKNPQFGKLAHNHGKSMPENVRGVLRKYWGKQKYWLGKKRPEIKNFKGFNRTGIRWSQSQRKKFEEAKQKGLVSAYARKGALAVKNSLKYKKTNIESILEKILIDANIKYEYKKRIEFYEVDFYLPDFNLIVECDGDFWHANPLFYSKKLLCKVQEHNLKNDNRKELFLKERKYGILRITEFELLRQPEIVNLLFSNIMNSMK